MQSPLRRFWPIGLLASLMAGAAHAQSTTDLTREALVLDAREGNLTSSISGLETLYRQTGDEWVRADLIALLLRAERFDEALAVCAGCSLEQYRPNELENLGGAARRVQAYEQALAFYQTLARRDPQNGQGYLGQALVNTDLERYPQAQINLENYEQVAGTTAQGLEARGYLASRTQNATQELAARQSLIERDPNNTSELQAIYRLAVGLGASSAARDLMSQNPDVFSASDRLWLAYYEAVTDIRLGIHTDTPSRTASGLTQLETVLANAELPDQLKTLAEYDKVVALAELRHFSEAEALSKRLELQNGTLPDYVLRARAQALGGLGQPDEATTLYRGLIARSPAMAINPDDPLNEGLFFSYTDAQRFKEADRLLQSWLTQEPEYRWDFTRTTQLPNANYQKVLLLEVLLTAWRGRMGEASERLAAYQDQAPGDPYLTITQGDLERIRGLPRQAEATYQSAEPMLAPDQRYQAEHGVLLARLQRGQWAGTTEAIAREVAQARPSPSRDELAREWREARAPQLSATFTRSSGEGVSTQASKEWRSEVRLDGPRNAQGSRPFITQTNQYGEFDDQDLRAATTVAGYELNLHPVTVVLSAGHGAQLGNDFLAQAELRYAVSDHVTATVAAEHNTIDTPLRALNDGVSADRYRGEIALYRDERGAGALGVSAVDFDDGNLRRSAYGYWRETLYHLDRWQVNGEAQIAASANDEVEASYFNPERDANLAGVLSVNYEIPLDYRQSFIQTLSLGAGRYWQKAFDDENTWSIGYGHRFELAPSFSLEYGITRERAVYDGIPEYDNTFTAGFIWRFL
ncbi:MULTISPECIES: poly-beta-1,6 N-acetyl-D-glucosamine export porin PgaA [unclassified Halomonas]|uniref:poly-beta-1,6 N-acetyl-D-glucosamine export porin PgaA n=1 Tax=unclassified Halomonas TaxID=2609666 RepID=UPI00207672DC|nr:MULTISPECIES: poly-beta-1,6 N-acetyl-D-glucosamine export porin PgaA [unclassified Halomonas]